MKKLFAAFCLLFLVLTLSAQNKTDLFKAIPSDTTLAFGVNLEKLYKLPLFQKYFADSPFVKNMQMNVGGSQKNSSSFQYMLFAMSDPTSGNACIQMLFQETPEIRKALIQGEQTKTVKYGKNTVYRMANGAEFMFPAPNRLLISTTSLEPYFNMKKGLPSQLTQVLANTDAKTLVNGFMILSAKLKAENPMAASMERITLRIDSAGKDNSALQLNLDAVCTNTDAAKQTMMLAQQMQLACGLFINNIDPNLAQDFNKSAVLKVDGSSVRLSFLVSEQLIQKLSVLAEPSVLKSMAADNSDF